MQPVNDTALLSWLEEFEPGPNAYVRHGLRRMAQTLNSIPSGQGKLLELGCDSHFTLMLSGFTQYQLFPQNLPRPMAAPEDMTERVVEFRHKRTAEVRRFERQPFDVEKDRFPVGDGFFDGALCCELLEHLLYDPVWMLWETNRVLQPGGWLLLTTPNLVSWHAVRKAVQGIHPLEHSRYFRPETADFPVQHTREYAPYEVVQMLQGAGFTVESMRTFDLFPGERLGLLDYLLLLPIFMIYNGLRGRHPKHLLPGLRHPHLFLLARKSGTPSVRFPEFLYV